MQILRLPEVIKRTGKARSTIYAEIKLGTFPAPVKIGLRAVGWHEEEILQWMETRAYSRYQFNK